MSTQYHGFGVALRTGMKRTGTSTESLAALGLSVDGWITKFWDAPHPDIVLGLAKAMGLGRWETAKLVAHGIYSRGLFRLDPSGDKVFELAEFVMSLLYNKKGGEFVMSLLYNKKGGEGEDH